MCWLNRLETMGFVLNVKSIDDDRLIVFEWQFVDVGHVQVQLAHKIVPKILWRLQYLIRSIFLCCIIYSMEPIDSSFLFPFILMWFIENTCNWIVVFGWTCPNFCCVQIHLSLTQQNTTPPPIIIGGWIQWIGPNTICVTHLDCCWYCVGPLL